MFEMEQRSFKRYTYKESNDSCKWQEDNHIRIDEDANF